MTKALKNFSIPSIAMYSPLVRWLQITYHENVLQIRTIFVKYRCFLPMLQHHDQQATLQWHPEGMKPQQVLWKNKETRVNVGCENRISHLYGMARTIPIVEKNDLSPHSATKTKTNVLARVLATDTNPAPFPENFETAISACHCSV